MSGAGIRRPRPVETLFAVSEAVGSQMDIADVLRQTTRELVRALAADLGSVWRVDPNDRALRPVAGFGIPATARSRRETDNVSAHLLAEPAPAVGLALYSSDSARDARFNHPLLRLLPHRSVLIQPLRIRGQLAGIFAFVWTRTRHRFNKVELRLVDAVTQQAAFAIENAELLSEVRDLNNDLDRRVRDRTLQVKRASEALRASRAELRALTAHLENVRESERSRVAREIHDELGQALTALKMDLARAARGDSGVDSAQLPAAIDEMIGTVRRISSELRPPLLDDLGLAAALKWQLATFQERTRVACRFRGKGELEEDAVDPERATAVFRIFQEIMTNIARHANATRVHVTLNRSDSSIRLVVRDNGRGIQESSGRSSRLGILGMKERAAAFGGVVRIAGTPLKGTTVHVRIPLDPAVSKARRR
jgi:signal transduction histidine kinase